MSFYSRFAGYYEEIFPFRQGVCDFITGHLSNDDRRILDAGCGTGHYSGRLAELGYGAVGVDLDSGMIEAARRRYPGASFHCMDLLESATLAPPLFDAVFSIGNVIAHLSRERLCRFLMTLGRLLKPGGLWCFQVLNFDPIVSRGRHTFPDIVVGEGETVFSREYPDISEDEIRFCTSLISSGERIFSGEERLYPLRAAEQLELHRKAGFLLEGHYADYAKKPFDSTVDSASIFVFHAAT